jgi:hypothetical protein
MSCKAETQIWGATVNCRCHVCAFFDSRDDEYSLMLPFMKERISVGDRAVYILDKHQRAERLQRLDDRSGYREHRAERPARSAALGKCMSQERALR